MIRPVLIVAALACTALSKPSRPTGAITSPAQWSVINSNGMRIHCDARDSVSGVSHVVFLASYADAAVRRRENVLIGIDSTAPYEIVWNCREVPDQAWTDLRLRCRIVNNDGRGSLTPSHFVILDRNNEHPDAVVASATLGRAEPVTVDGNHDDTEPWERAAPVTFTNDDNAYSVRSLHDDDHLYLLVSIVDDAIMNRYDTTPGRLTVGDTLYALHLNAIPSVWLDDCISLSFDTKNDKDEVLDFDDKVLHVVPGGRLYSFSLSSREHKATAWAEGVRVCSRSVDKARDSGRMIVEMAIPWRDLGVIPQDGTTMGFQVYVTDRDLPDGERVISSWTGQPHNHYNPSEWGSLVLTADTNRAVFFRHALLAAAVVLAATGGLSVWYVRRRISTKPSGTNEQAKESPGMQPDAADVICRQARAFIDEHLTDPALHRKTIARHLNLSAPYLSSVFNKKAGESLPAYINRRRLAMARDLLRDPRNSVSRVALEVGYNSPDHFIRTFKAANGMTPREFQRQCAMDNG